MKKKPNNSAELTVAYIKQALKDVFIKPSVFADNIVDRISDDIASKKDLYRRDYFAFKQYLERVYFQRMSDKMVCQVFKAFAYLLTASVICCISART